MRNKKSMRGYTLLELIVAMGIFSVVMLAATGAYITLLKLDRQARAVNDIANNLSFAVDSMARSIRAGTSYKCNNNASSPNCTGTPGTTFGFNDSESPARAIEYKLSGPNGQVQAVINGGTPVPLTDPRIQINALEFRVRGVGVGDGVQPQVTFSIRGTMVIGPSATTSFAIQGGATSRLLEI